MSENKKTTVDVSTVISGDVKSVDFSFDFCPECIDKDIVFPAPLKVTGRVYEKASAKNGSQNLVMANIALKGKYVTKCARCLENIDVPVDMYAEYSVASELQNDEDESEDVLLAPGGVLDIGEAADSLFFMNVPSKHLCSESCKGLCQGCGKNLNTEECVCDNKNIDPRLAVLKKLLDKQ